MLEKIIKKYSGEELEIILKKLEKNNFPCRFGDLKGLSKIELVYYLKHCLDQKEPNEIKGVSRKKLFKILNADTETQEVLNEFFNTRAVIDKRVEEKEFTNIAEMVDNAELLMNIAITGEIPCKISDLDKLDTLDKKIEYIKYCVNRATDKLQTLTLEDLVHFDTRTLNEIYNNINLIIMELDLTYEEEKELFNVLNITHLFRKVIKQEEGELIPYEEPQIISFSEMEENPMYFETEENPLYE